MEDEQYDGETPFSSAQLLRPTGLRHYQLERAPNGSTQWSGPHAALYKHARTTISYNLGHRSA
jgi:hypothetical protein